MAEQTVNRGEKRCSGCKGGQLILPYKPLFNLVPYNKDYLDYVSLKS